MRFIISLFAFLLLGLLLINDTTLASRSSIHRIKKNNNNHNIMYPNPKLPETNVTVIATAHTKRFIHAFATGTDRVLYHKYVDLLTSPTGTGGWTDWIVRAKAVNGTWEGDPCVGVNQDGTIHVFIRYSTGLDLWQLYQKDADDPNSFSFPRESSCPAPPDCPQPWDTYFWNKQPVFPTSDCQVIPDPKDGRLQVFIRGFTGEYYRVVQKEINSPQYGPPQDFGESSLIE